MVESQPRHLFSVDEYERMGEAGIFHPEARVELIYGEIVTMSPLGGPHLSCVNRSARALMRQTDGDEYYVQVQGSIRIPGKRSEPEPDLVVMRVGYDERKPVDGADVLLVIEVSDSTLAVDRGVKLPLYAAAGIPEAWLFNLPAKRLERHTDPQPGGYRSVAYAERGQRIASTVLPDVIVDADELLSINAPR